MTIKLSLTLEATLEVKGANTREEALKRLDKATLFDTSNGYGFYAIDTKPLQPIIQDSDFMSLEYSPTTEEPSFVFDGKNIYRL